MKGVVEFTTTRQQPYGMIDFFLNTQKTLMLV